MTHLGVMSDGIPEASGSVRRSEIRERQPLNAVPTLVRSQAMPEEQAPDPDPERADPFRIQDWTQLVERIHDGDPAAMEELYAIFGKGIRYFFLRNLGADELDNRVHDCFVIVTQAIRNGELRDPARLMGYVRTVVKRQIAATIEAAVNRRRTQVDYEQHPVLHDGLERRSGANAAGAAACRHRAPGDERHRAARPGDSAPFLRRGAAPGADLPGDGAKL